MSLQVRIVIVGCSERFPMEPGVKKYACQSICSSGITNSNTPTGFLYILRIVQIPFSVSLLISFRFISHMASSTSSVPPRSPHSPSQPLTAASTSTLEILIPHLLASKRSLSSVSHVYRANELCSFTRQALETSALVTVRTSFLRNGIVSQLGVLQQLQHQTNNTATQAKTEYETVVKGLDMANTRLKGTLHALRETFVEPGLRPEAEERKSLLDFVDESGVEESFRITRNLLDEAGESIASFEDTNLHLKGEATNVRRILTSEKDATANYFEERCPLPDILHEMEHYAKGMARELESLVTHYDLCVTAVKHTEGGSDAAFKMVNELPEGDNIERDVSGPTKPISDEQREEMIRVIEDDAGDVEGAVMDIKNHLVEMENLHGRVEAYIDRLMGKQAAANAAFKLLEALGRKLPSYITQSQVFLVRWESEKARIDERLEELEGLTLFYNGFLRAYDNLLIEIGRRKTVEQKIEKEVQGARARFEKLYEDDAEQRDAFRKEQGEFLPVDIWPGLRAGPLRFEIAPLDDEAARVPNISNSVIHRAIKRVHGNQ